MVGVLTLLPSLLLLPPLSSALPEIIKIGQTKKKIIKNQAVSVLIICGLGSQDTGVSCLLRSYSF